MGEKQTWIAQEVLQRWKGWLQTPPAPPPLQAPTRSRVAHPLVQAVTLEFHYSHSELDYSCPTNLGPRYLT